MTDGEGDSGLTRVRNWRVVGDYIHVYRKLFATRAYRSRLLLSVLAFLGAVATVLQVAVWTLDIDEADLRKGWVVGLVALGTLVVIGRSIPRRQLQFVHPTSNARIIIEMGDLLEIRNQAVVLTANRFLDTDPRWVTDSSLIGQLATKWFGTEGNPRDRLGAMISAATGEPAGFEYPVGSVASLERDDQRMLLLAVSSRHHETRSAVLIDDIWTALSGLWGHARSNGLTSVSVPIVGSGFAQAQVGVTPLLFLLLTSYVTAAMERPLCKLHIVVSPAAVDPSIFELSKSYCDSLGFREHHGFWAAR
jgi:hypothetical protein